MKAFKISAGAETGFVVPFLVSIAVASPFRLHKFATVERDTFALKTSYDYVIIGGGTSGLTVANRLSEDSSKTVLVVEYGPLDNDDPEVLIPADVTKSLSSYLFKITSTPQPFMNNRTTTVSTGAVVGGGTAVNGMFFDRGAAEDYDNWSKLGNPGWDWNGIFPYFRKSTTFTPPIHDLKKFNISYDRDAYGDGPVHSSYPRYQWPGQKPQWNAWLEMGIQPSKEINGGDAFGLAWVPNSEDPVSETRSFARTAYYEPIKTRPNLHLLVGHKVSEVIFSEDLEATGITFQERNSTEAKVLSVEAKVEVILAAGAVHSPQILQCSGIGAKNLLAAAGIKQKVDLPGVGANLQDHPNVFVAWQYLNNTTPNPSMMTPGNPFYEEAIAEYYANKTGPRTMAASNSGVFLPLRTFTSKWKDIIASATAVDGRKGLPASYDRTLLAGYKVQRALIIDSFASNRAACMEMPFGGGTGAPAVVLKPLSRGTININPADPYGEVIIDSGGLSDPIDVKTFVEIIKSIRQWLQTPAHQSLGPVETAPTANLTTDTELEALIRNSVNPSFAHTSGTLSMMPRHLGGVVSPGLLVYGTKRLSVVDASIMPLIPGTHLSATVYAIAEKAADIIKNRHQ
ncbi:alcohol oxidase [Cadophora sp. MPI-SDFR-AT-0126]|nr:alcohol oxidase [Leotiomycetes sp. MPI-SDFR-AT-0126]